QPLPPMPTAPPTPPIPWLSVKLLWSTLVRAMLPLPLLLRPPPLPLPPGWPAPPEPPIPWLRMNVQCVTERIEPPPLHSPPHPAPPTPPPRPIPALEAGVAGAANGPIVAEGAVGNRQRRAEVAGQAAALTVGTDRIQPSAAHYDVGGERAVIDRQRAALVEDA